MGCVTGEDEVEAGEVFAVVGFAFATVRVDYGVRGAGQAMAIHFRDDVTEFVGDDIERR